MKNLIINLPKNKTTWKEYSVIFWPIVVSSMLFTADGLVGNFMVGHITEGTASLAAINAWTNIIVGFFVGSAAAGSIIMAQYYFSNDFEKAKEVARIRNIITISVASFFIILAWVVPNTLINVFLNGNTQDPSYRAAYEGAQSYLKVISLNWFLIAITFNFGYIFRETKNGKGPLIWGVFTLLTSIIINCILLYGFHFGVAGAAWGTVGGRLVALSIAIFFIYKNNLEFGFKPWTIFQISGKTWIQFWKRWYMFLSFVSLFIFINARLYFWDYGYPIKETSSLGEGIGAVTVLGIAAAISKVFSTAFSSIGAMAAVFIGSELGKGNLKKAKRNSDEIRLYSTLMAILLAILLIVFASFLPWMTLFSSPNNLNMDSSAHLHQTKNVLYAIAFWYPIRVWLMTTYRNASSGGKSFWFALTNWIGGSLEVASLAIIIIFIVPNVVYFQENMWISYLLFLAVDLVQLTVMEILYRKTKWLHVLRDNVN